jgi:hypothetical protein
MLPQKRVTPRKTKKYGKHKPNCKASRWKLALRNRKLALQHRKTTRWKQNASPISKTQRWNTYSQEEQEQVNLETKLLMKRYLNYGKAFQLLMNKLTDEEQRFVLHGCFTKLTSNLSYYFTEATKMVETCTNVEDTVIRIKGCYFNCYQQTPIIFDSGASTSVSPNKEDFVTFTKTYKHLNGLNGGAEVQGEGTVKWTVYTDRGKRIVITTYAYYVPDTTDRLFSPIPYFRQPGNTGGNGCFKLTENGATITFPNSTETISMQLPNNALPGVYPIVSLPTSNETALVSVLEESNLHLTADQKYLLLWHQRIGHFGMQRIQALFRSNYGTSPRLLTTTKAATCDIPKCEACLTSKATKRPNQSQLVQNVDNRQRILRREHLQPGDMVSDDQYESTVRGCLPHTWQRANTSTILWWYYLC